MKNLKFSRLFAAAMLVACFAFAGCKPQVEEVTVEKVIVVKPLEADEGILGTWANSSEKYEIQTNSFRSIGYDTWTDPSNPAWTESYTGNTLCVRYTSATAGYIYIKYTKSMNPDYSYSTTAPDVGKWYAIAFKDLNTSTSTKTIKLAGAYNASGVTSTTTLESAIETFTIENGYFASFSDLEKE